MSAPEKVMKILDLVFQNIEGVISKAEYNLSISASKYGATSDLKFVDKVKINIYHSFFF